MRITIQSQNQIISQEYSDPVTLSQAVRDAGLTLDMPCNGKGTCGKCRVLASGSLSSPDPREEKILGNELSQGVRLACMTTATGDCQITLGKKDSQILSDGILPAFDFSPMGEKYGFAVDIGTTTVAVYLLDLSDGKRLDRDSFPNPQSSFGADVVSRIQEYLNGNGNQLQDLISQSLTESFSNLCKRHHIPKEDIDSIVITGNTTMLYLLCNQSVEPLSHSPFEITEFYGEFLSPQIAGISGFSSARLYLPRTISAFVGSDITSAILSSDIINSGKISLLMDIGTNGEMAISDNGKLYCCSTAAGPAFEGAGITMGMSAGAGAIDFVSAQDGIISYTTIKDEKARGICGSGLIDAMAALLDAGLVDESGCIDEENETYSDYLTEYHDQPAIKIGDSGVILTQKDIREIQLAKSALCAGVYSLIHAAGRSVEEVDELILAGGFGSFINCQSAGRIGMIPKELVNKTKAAGNAAGMGAIVALLSEKSRLESEDTAQSAETLELSTSPYFMDKYVECMMF